MAGFDDDIYARLCNPRLTSMSVDVSRKAELAVNMLMRLIDGEEVRESEPKIDAVIAERESVMKVEEMDAADRDKRKWNPYGIGNHPQPGGKACLPYEKCKYNWNQERGSLSVRIPRMPAARLFELEVVQS